MGEPSRSLPTSWISKLPKKRPRGTGKKKIEIKKIENKFSRKVAFSKRRQGMFKKAGELCRLCDAEIAIIVFSPKGRLYSFGHPSQDHVIDKFLLENDDDIYFSDDNDCVTELIAEEKYSLEKSSPKEEEGFWWKESIEDLKLEELERYQTCLAELRYNVAMKLEEMVMRRTCERDFFGSKTYK